MIKHIYFFSFILALLLAPVDLYGQEIKAGKGDTIEAQVGSQNDRVQVVTGCDFATGIITITLPARQTSVLGGDWSSSYDDIHYADIHFQLPSDGKVATYNSDNGRLFGQLVDQSLEGYWVEDYSVQRCATPKDGSNYWGSFRFVFNGSFTAFSGRRNYCEASADRGKRWRGELKRLPEIRRVAGVLARLNAGKARVRSNEVFARQGAEQACAWLRQTVTASNLNKLEGRSYNLTFADQITNHALSKVCALVERILVGTAPSHVWDEAIRAVEVAREYLAIYNDELDPDESPLVQDIEELADSHVGRIPVYVAAVPLALGLTVAVVVEGPAIGLTAATRVLFFVGTQPARAALLAEFGIGTIFNIVASGGIEGVATPEGAAEILVFYIAMRGAGPPPVPGGGYRTRTARVRAQVTRVDGNRVKARVVGIDYDVEPPSDHWQRSCRQDPQLQDFLAEVNARRRASDAQLGLTDPHVSHAYGQTSREAVLRAWELRRATAIRGMARRQPLVRPSRPRDRDAVPRGTRTHIDVEKMDAETQRGLRAENRAADVLAQNGYDVERNPVIPEILPNPDYRIEGEIFDCYAPRYKRDPRRIFNHVKSEKIETGQTQRVVLNLDDTRVRIKALRREFDRRRNEVPDLQQVLAVKGNTVFKVFPKPSGGK